MTNWTNCTAKRYLILHDALDSSAGEEETVTQCKITTHWWFGATASEFLQLFLHRTILPLD